VSPPKKPPPSVTLRDFGDLKRALGKAAKEAAARAEHEREARARREAAQRTHDADAHLFKTLVGNVHRLPDTGRMGPTTARPAPVPTSRQQDEQAVLIESLSDDFDVESLLETDESLSWRRPELGVDVVRKLRRGVWALQGELDLHGLRTDEARTATSGFLREAQLKGWRCVRIVHGKGLGSPGKQPVLRDKVKRWLVQSERVLAFVQARADEGGVGAVVVLLQSSQKGAAMVG
jgi:DNA-nicking Smr family endonuclease